MTGQPSKQCVNRLQKEYKAVLKEPPPDIKAHPNPNNILEWHYVIEGNKGSDFEGGVYHGKLLFQPTYPFKAPGIMMLTPNGRFAIGQRLCLSMSDFHPETWNPLWSVGTILTGLQSFMYDDARTTGSMSASPAERRRLASISLEQNLRDPMFKRLFPEYLAELEQRKQEQCRRQQQAEANGSSQAPEQQPKGRSLSSLLLMTAFATAAGSILLIPLLGS